MNIDQQARLEIMRALEKDFPDRPLEDLIHVARYVEAGGIEQDRAESQDNAAKSVEETTGIPEWRTWADLEHIPGDVRAVTDADGDRAEPQVVLGKREWFFTSDPFNGSVVSPDDGPFTEVLENE